MFVIFQRGGGGRRPPPAPLLEKSKTLYAVLLVSAKVYDIFHNIGYDKLRRKTYFSVSIGSTTEPSIGRTTEPGIGNTTLENIAPSIGSTTLKNIAPSIGSTTLEND